MNGRCTWLTKDAQPRAPHLILHAERSPFNRSQTSKASGASALHYQSAEQLFYEVSEQAESRDFHRFVGFLCTKEHTYICLPKVFYDHLPGNTFVDEEPQALTESTYKQWRARAHLLRKALVRYHQQHTKQSAVELLKAYLPDRKRPNTQKPVSHLALAQLILDDYKQYGVWRDDTHVHIRGGSGQVNWTRTIHRGGELFIPQKKGFAPVYPEPITRQHQRHQEHPLTLAQIAVIHDLKALYGPILTEAPINAPPIPSALHSFKSLPALGKQLKRSLRGLFRQRARRLADLLVRYIELDDRGRKGQVDAFGTTSFHTLFEHMCVEVMGADPKAILGDEKLSEVTWDFHQSLKPLIQETKRTGSHQKIDLLVKANDVSEPHQSYTTFELKSPDQGEYLLVLDAKYYDLIGALKHSSNSSASHLPKLEDIRKQYAYAEWLHTQYGDKFKKEKIINGLVFPTFGLTHVSPKEDLQDLSSSEDPLSALLDRFTPFERLGSVKMGESNEIQVLGINIDRLMRDYAEGRRYNEIVTERKTIQIKNLNADR